MVLCYQLNTRGCTFVQLPLNGQKHTHHKFGTNKITMDAIKAIVIGDSGVGKTSIIVGYTLNKCQTWEYTPTIYDSYLKVETIDEQDITLSFFDTSGSQLYEKVRVVAYPVADVVIACFSITDWISFRNIYERWYHEIRYYGGRTRIPIILVGTKLDVRDTNEMNGIQDETFVTYEHGIDMADKIGAARYVECSSYTYDGLRNVVDEAVRAVRLM